MSSRAGAAWCAKRTSRRIEPRTFRVRAGPGSAVHHFVSHRIRDKVEDSAMNRTLAALVGLGAMVGAQTSAAETLKVAVAQPGFWNSTFIDVGLKQGYFKQVGLDIEILYTEGGASTLTPVIAGSIDIAIPMASSAWSLPMPRACRSRSSAR